MTDQASADQPPHEPGDEKTHPALDRLQLLWASPPIHPDWSPARRRRSTAKDLGHLDLDATEAYIRRAGDQP
ncbi:hypothetical protein AB0D10_01185 [Kitasatospora sp. NPDC048545]|uniref:hypothetical protein n=1 Tax=Kitasatospora sp. NPDC048545 TaxID=3157208 RepID=UPI0033FDE5F6